MAYQCQFCGAAVTLGEPIPRESSCEGCRRDYHRSSPQRYGGGARERFWSIYRAAAALCV